MAHYLDWPGSQSLIIVEVTPMIPKVWVTFEDFLA
jgi:hypothetical protein